ncbi:MAG: hypothetical protein RLZZ367_1740 [Bacteroidota bacterium]|jgi:uncharacterized protein (TIGR01777 family)
MGKILITGASGLVGSRLKQLLEEEGHTVHTLGRAKTGGAGSFTWNPAKGTMDEKALEGVTTIIHLAGAGVAEKRWTDERKKEILDSRVQSTAVLFKYLKKHPNTVNTLVSASAVGYYGDCGASIVTEEHTLGEGFLADVCQQWEDGVTKFESLGIRTVRCRIGIVLAKDGGALPELARTIPAGIAGYFAKPDLYYPWIHLDDVCGIMIHAVKTQSVQGAYNTTAPKPLLIKELLQHIVKAKRSHAMLAPVPPFALKLALGEMSTMLLNSQRCSADKILKAGYRFRFADIDKALKDIYKTK